jgi:hypothetical protein
MLRFSVFQATCTLPVYVLNPYFSFLTRIENKFLKHIVKILFRLYNYIM